MNLNMTTTKNETKDLLLFNTKNNFETIIQQIHASPEKMLEFRLIKPREAFLFNPHISIDGSWMIGLSSLEVYIFVSITEENNKIELYKYPGSKIGCVAYEKIRGDIEKDLEITDNKATDLQDVIVYPIKIEEYREKKQKE